ncbi:MAG: type II toxin-antitoxin system MqsA family antitoxin [Actinobacteria bacterium]|nr:type II toxin-antitoxin system MqsA family antitoxin [Actinomycetota bacterium]MCL6087103.1 type II toxin-antitoxin system MqsA family antitoxin [Actinomycetota bacterium]
MKCIFCGGKLEKKIVTFYYEESGKYILVQNVPAEVCMKCGEKIYSPEVTDELLKFAKDKFKPVKSIKIPVFDFAKKALAS